MPKAPRPWIVGKHGPIQKLEENLWCVEDTLPNGMIQRRMVIIKRSDGSLVFYQAVPVDDATLAEIKAWGTPAVLIVPHDQHGRDARAFAEKLGVKIYGPKRTEATMRAKFNLSGNAEDLPADPSVRFEAMEGTKSGEPVGVVRSQSGVSLLFADAFMANPSEGMPLPMRILGFGGGPKVSPVFRLLFTSDKAALRSHFEKLAALPGLKNLVPCHGRIESKDASGTLKRVAATL